MTDKTIIADEVVSRSIATVQDAVAGFDTFQAGIAAIAAAHPVDVACDLTTTAGTKVAIAGRAAWRDPRIALEKARKAAKAPVLELGKAIDAFAGRIEAQLLIGENNYDGQIKAHEAAVKDAAIARARAEAERIARHEAGLNTIRLYVQKANGLDSAKLRLGIEALADQRYGAEWEEFAAKAVIAQTETLEVLQSMLNIAIAREEEAAERERQRAENARVAAELAAERAALAAQKAKDDAAAAELRKAEDEKRAAELVAQRAEQARIDVQMKAQQAALDAQAAELKRQAEAIAAHNAAAEKARADMETKAGQDSSFIDSLMPRADVQEYLLMGQGERLRDDVLPAMTRPAAAAEPAAEELLSMVRWAYGKLHRQVYSKQEDALMLDRMKLILEHGL